MNPIRNLLALGTAAALLAACGTDNGTATDSAPAPAPVAETAAPVADPAPPPAAHEGAFVATDLTRFDSPWAMTFLPDGRLLVTQMSGELKLYDPASNSSGDIGGVPQVTHVAQGGLGDVVLHPHYADNQWVYLSYVETDETGLGAVVETPGGRYVRSDVETCNPWRGPNGVPFEWDDLDGPIRVLSGGVTE